MIIDVVLAVLSVAAVLFSIACLIYNIKAYLYVREVAKKMCRGQETIKSKTRRWGK